MKKGKRIRHAFHNQELCKILHENGKFPDWVITTAFYTAIHFVSYKIFPVKGITDTGHEYELKTIDEFHRFHQCPSSKHQTLADLVFNNFPGISPEYDWLMNLCSTARYQNYQQTTEDATRAIKLLEKIRTTLSIEDNVS